MNLNGDLQEVLHEMFLSKCLCWATDHAQVLIYGIKALGLQTLHVSSPHFCDNLTHSFPFKSALAEKTVV